MKKIMSLLLTLSMIISLSSMSVAYAESVNLISEESTTILSSGSVYGSTDTKAFDGIIEATENDISENDLTVKLDANNSIIFDLGNTYNIEKVKVIYNVLDWENSADWSVQGSYNNLTWTNLGTYTAQSPSSFAEKEISFTAGVYRYIKLTTGTTPYTYTDGNGGTQSQYLRLREIEVYGDSTPAEAPADNTQYELSNVALGKNVTRYSNTNAVSIETILNDGDYSKYYSKYNTNYFEIDLGKDYKLSEINVFLAYGSTGTYTVKAKNSTSGEYKTIGTVDYSLVSTATEYSVSSDDEYYRYIQYCSPNGDSQIVIYEIEVMGYVAVDSTSVSLVNTADTKLISSGAIYGSSDIKAFDKNGSSALIAYPDENKSIVLDLGNTYTIDRFVLDYSVVSWEKNTRWQVLASTDNSTWNAIAAIYTLSDSSDVETVYMEPVNARYIKMVSSVGSGQYLRADEIDIYGNPLPVGYEYVRKNLALNKTASRPDGTVIKSEADDVKYTDGLTDKYVDDYSYSNGYMIDLGKDYPIDEIALKISKFSTLGTFTLSAKKNSSSEFTSLGTIEFNQASQVVNAKNLLIDKENYRYIKISFTPDEDFETKHTVMYEFEVYGYDTKEIEWEEANLTQNGNTSVFLNVEDGNISTISNIYDNSESTSWYSKGYNITDTVIDLGMKYDISSVYYNFHGSQNISNRTYDVQVSTDNVNYETVGSVTPSSSDEATRVGSVEFEECNARYVRFKSAKGGQIGWYEIKVFGKYKKILGATGYISPDNGDTGVSTLTQGKTTGIIKFGYDMNTDTLADYINISADGVDVDLTDEYTVTDNSYIFNLDALASNTEYTVTISKDVQKADNTSFGNDYSYKFTTGDIIKNEEGKMIKNIALGKAVTAYPTENTLIKVTDGVVAAGNYGYAGTKINNEACTEQYMIIDLGNWYDVELIKLYERNIYSADDNNLYVKASGATSDISKMETIEGPCWINTDNGAGSTIQCVNVTDTSDKKYRYIAVYRNEGVNSALCLGEVEVYAQVDVDFADVVFKDSSSNVVNEMTWGNEYTASLNYDSAIAADGYTMIVSAYNEFGKMNYYEEFECSVEAREASIDCTFTLPEDSIKIKAVFGKYSADGTFEVVAASTEAPASEAGMTLTEYVTAVMSEDGYHSDILSDALKKNEFNISFVGGSITQGGSPDGWVAKTADNISAAIKEAGYSDITVNVNNAGYGGTGSEYGVIRLAEDVIAYNPDMVFVEFAVNDNNGYPEDEILKQMEGIVNQLQACEKIPMIAYVYTSSNIFASRADVHQKVADYYNIASVDLGEYLEKQAKYNGLDVSKYFSDSVHPSSAGQQLYADVIWSKLNKNPEDFFKQPDVKETTLTQSPYTATGASVAWSELVYSGSWTDADGYKKSNTANDTAEFTFTGSQLLILAPTGEGFDGTLKLVIKNDEGNIVDEAIVDTSIRNSQGNGIAKLNTYTNLGLEDDTYTVTLTNEDGKTTGIYKIYYAK